MHLPPPHHARVRHDGRHIRKAQPPHRRGEIGGSWWGAWACCNFFLKYNNAQHLQLLFTIIIYNYYNYV